MAFIIFSPTTGVHFSYIFLSFSNNKFLYTSFPCKLRKYNVSEKNVLVCPLSVAMFTIFWEVVWSWCQTLVS